MEKLSYDQQEHNQKDLNDSDCQDFDQELYEVGLVSCLESGPELEPDPDSVSFLPSSVETDHHQCFSESPVTVRPHSHECHRCGRTMSPSSSPSPASASATSPKSQQKKTEQKEFEAKLLSRGYAKITLPGNHHRLPSDSVPERSAAEPSFLKIATPSKPKPSLLPPLPPLCRTTSDPTPEKLHPLPAPAMTHGNVNVLKNAASWRLKRMRHRQKENKIHNETEKDGAESENDQENVSAEKIGDSSLVQIKCSCSKGYKILVAGRHIYYKLVVWKKDF